jgi:hypothetical protein
MTTSSATTSDLTGFIDPAPLVDLRKEWVRWAGPLMSLGIIGVVIYQLRSIPVRELMGLVPATPLFWISFALYFAAGPISEWVIFRRLWELPVGGLAALFRKMVSNNLLLGYLGEAYFYAWARGRAKMVAAPFGAVKDVAVLSALTGNVVTLLLVAATAPVFLSLHLGLSGRTMALSIAFMVASSLAMMLLRHRLFSLPRADLWFVSTAHVVRIIATIGLSALCWHLILPGVALSWWLLLATLRQLVTRLPFVPNKEVLFAGLAIFFVGREGEIVDAITLVASLTVFATLVTGAVLGLSELVQAEREIPLGG